MRNDYTTEVRNEEINAAFSDIFMALFDLPTAEANAVRVPFKKAYRTANEADSPLDWYLKRDLLDAYEKCTSDKAEPVKDQIASLFLMLFPDDEISLKQEISTMGEIDSNSSFPTKKIAA